MCLLQNPSYRKLNHTERDLRSIRMRGIKLTVACTVVLSSNLEKVISDLKRENQFFFKRDLGVCMIDLLREICKPVLKLDFTARGILDYWNPFQNLDSVWYHRT